ncbi:hypothetical protein BGZ97_009680, partial [Linnemannia gamsii]
MNSNPFDQLDSQIACNDCANTTARKRRSDSICNAFGFKSKPKDRNQPAIFGGDRLIHTIDNQQVTLSDNLYVNSGDEKDKPLPPLPTDAQPSAAQPIADIFGENVPKPVIKTGLPCLQQRIERTDQLVYCNTLLLQDSLSPPFVLTGAKATQNPVDTLRQPALDKAELTWLEEMKKFPMEADRLRWLASRMVEQFLSDINKDSTKIAEIVSLGPILQKEAYRKLLSAFIEEFDEASILDVDILQGLVQLVQDTSPGYLSYDDLIKILSAFRTRLECTHQQSTESSYHLTLAVSRIFDVMADHKVQDLDRVLGHEPLSAVLSGLKDSSDPYLMYQACYAFQALQYVPDDETALLAMLRHATGVANGLIKIPSVIKLDLSSVLDGLANMCKALECSIEIATSTYGGACSLKESGRGVLNSLKNGLGPGQKRPWYPAVKAAYAFSQAGQLKDLRQLIIEAPCRHDPLFQWGISQLLGDIAVDLVWTTATRQQAIYLLGHLYQHDQNWGKDESVKAWMLAIFTKLNTTFDQDIEATTRAFLRDLGQDNTTAVKYSCPLSTRFIFPTTSPLLTKVQEIPYLEYELRKLRLQRLKEVKLSVYIPPMAKANLQARDDDLFLLMDKVQDFLASDRQVMLILGDSGAGKSTFDKHLESKLLRSYSSGGPIPLFIYLPSIDRPDKDVVAQHLRIQNFQEDHILELKQYRQFVLICDGYDESQLTTNLHTTNLFNRPGQWNVKMVISCRTQFLGQDYRSRFIPDGDGHYNRQATELFQEAVIAPFSKEQIENYVEQYVPLEPRTWTTKDYIDKLIAIPNLMDLVKNPFLLSLSLEALPGVTEGKHDLSAIKITRVQLYDTFVRHWLDVNSRRLQRNALCKEDRNVLDQLIEAGFTSMGIGFSTKLAAAIFEHQDGAPVVQYVHFKDKRSWRAEFFSADPEVRLLRESSPLTRAGSQFRFLHRSILEYFFSCSVLDPSSFDDNGVLPSQSDAGSGFRLFDAKGPLFKRSLLTEPSVIQFLCERVKNRQDLKEQLLSVIIRSKTDATAATAAANAITILVKAGVHFNSADLRGIRIPGADLSDGQFDSAQLQGAYLTDVNFTRSWLRQAELSDTYMDGVRFGELPSLKEESAVIICSYSPGGNLMAVGLQDRCISIYDTSTWTKVRRLGASNADIYSMAFSPNNQKLVSGHQGGMIHLWDVASGGTFLVIHGHTFWMSTVRFSPCGRQIASVGDDEAVRLWDAQTGKPLFVLKGHAGDISTISYSLDGQRLISKGEDRTVRVWNPSTGEQVAHWSTPHSNVMSVAFSADGQRIAFAFGHAQEKIQLMDAIVGTPSLILDCAEKVKGINLSPNGQWIAFSNDDNIIRLWDTSTGARISSFSGHQHPIYTLASSPDGLQLISGDCSGRIRLWEIDTTRSTPAAQVQSGGVQAIAFTPNGRAILSVGKFGGIQQRDVLTGTSLAFPVEKADNVSTFAVNLESGRIMLGYRDGAIRLHSGQPEKTGRAFLGHTEKVTHLVCSPCGHWMISGCNDETTRLWDLEQPGAQGQVLNAFIAGSFGHVCASFSPVPKKIATGASSKETAEFYKSFLPKTVTFGATVSLFSLSQKVAIVAGFGGVYLLDLPPESAYLEHVRSPLVIRSLDFSPDGRRLVVGTSDNSVCLWNLHSNTPDTKLIGHDGEVSCVACLPCGKWILSGSQDRT